MKTADDLALYQAFGFSDKGKVRADNQDDYLILNRNGVWLVAVADGIGGLNSGAQASRFLTQGLTAWWRQNEAQFGAYDSPIGELENSLEACIAALNKQLLANSEKMGSTLSLLLLYKNHYLIKHAGDSRIYFLRDFGFEQLTHDHTWYEREKLRQPDKPPEQRKMRNVLVNAMGVKSDYFLETAKGDLRNVLAVLLCTDGVYKYFTADKMEELLLAQGAIEEKLEYLRQFLQSSPAADNYTAIILQKDNLGYGIGK